MLRALHTGSYTEALPSAHWLRRLTRAKLIVALRWLVTVSLIWLILRSLNIAAVLGLIARAPVPDLGLAGVVLAIQVVLLVRSWQLVMHILVGEAIGSGRAAVKSRSVVCDPLLGFLGLTFLVPTTVPIIAGRMGGLAPILTLAMTLLRAMAAAVMLVLAFPFILLAVSWLKRPAATAAADLRLTLCCGKVSLVAVAVSVAQISSAFCRFMFSGQRLTPICEPATACFSYHAAGGRGCGRGLAAYRLEQCPAERSS